MNGHRMDQETVERLLVGTVAEAQDGPQELVRFLAAVRAAPRPDELSGEGAALQAFRVARAGGAVPRAVSPPPRRLHAGLLGAKVALAAVLATATGGVALAAVTGNLPGPPRGGGDAHPTPSPGAGTDGPATPAADPSRPGTPGAAPGPTDRPASPSALAGLCTAYRAKNAADRGRALEAPAFAALVSAAGGRDKVPAYCDKLLPGKARATGGNPTPPAPSADPTRRPGTGPTTRVTGRPEPTPDTSTAGLAPTTQPGRPPARTPASVRPSRR